MRRNWTVKTGVILLSVCLLSGCSGQRSSEQNQTYSGSEEGEVRTQDQTASSAGEETAEAQNVVQTMRELEAEDYYEDFSDSITGEIHFLGDRVSLEGSSLKADDSNTVTILAAGTYVVDGTIEEGSILVDAEKDAVVRIVLNGTQIHCSTTSAIYGKQASKVIVSLAPDTENVLSDEASYTFAAGEDEPDATLFVKGDLVINGTGSLTVEARYGDGIKSKDNLTIVSGTIVITAEDDGIVGRDSLLIQDGTFTVQAEGDGIRSSNDTDSSKGNVWILGGTFTITTGADTIQSVNGLLIQNGVFVLDAGTDGIQAETALQIAGGDFTVTTGGGSKNSSKTSSQWGQWGGGKNFWGSSNDNTEDTQDSAKGIKAETLIQISGGTFQVDSSDDSIHCNGDITITGGTFAMASGDDGIHADDTVTISGGTISITESYEGIEGQNIMLQGGTIDVMASDDGINISGGNDNSGMGGRPGQSMFSGSGSGLLTISGGTISVNASGDGLDSNGSIVMTGGTLYVSGPEDSGNGTLDFNGTFDLTGGIFVGAGSSGMMQYPDSSTGQCILVMTFSAMEAGTKCVLTDSSGTELVSFSPEKRFQSVEISLPELTKGETYHIAVGSVEKDVTISDTVTVLSDGTSGQPGNGSFGHGGRGNGSSTPENGIENGNFPGSDFSQDGKERGEGKMPDFGEPAGNDQKTETDQGGTV